MERAYGSDPRTGKQLSQLQPGAVLIFPGFLWRYPIVKYHTTPGVMDQDSGIYTPPSDQSGNISAIIQEISFKDLQQGAEGLISLGDRTLTALKTDMIVPGDWLKITEDASGNTTEWVVDTQRTNPNAIMAGLKQDFQTFILKRTVNK